MLESLLFHAACATLEQMSLPSRTLSSLRMT